jgi:cell wall-associated NlpC family hydrolase
MANLYTKKELQQFPIRKYEAIRSELQTGDIVFCSGNYIFSKIIQGFTKSVWSHVGVIYRDEAIDRVLILESETGIGVRLAPFSKYLKDYHGKNKPYKGNMFIGKINPQVPLEKRKLGISYGLDELTKPYDNWEIIRIAIRLMFGITKKQTDRKYICSELVQEVFNHADIKFPTKNSIISPVDIWIDKRVEMRYRLR